MAKRAGLGRGLSALLDEGAAAAASGGGATAERTLPVASIVANARQPRRRFDPAALDELTESVRRRGVLQPILVRPLGDGRFEIVAGERRWRAAQAARLHDMPVVVRELDDATAFEVALVENLQRADLNPIEEAEGYARLSGEGGHSQAEIAGLVGKSRPHVANLLRLLDLSDEVRDLVRSGELTMGHARALVGAAEGERLARRAVAEGLSVREVERLARAGAAARPRAIRTTAGRDPNLAELEALLGEALGLPVRVQPGRVEIAYATVEQLDLVCARLSGERATKGEPRVVRL